MLVSPTEPSVLHSLGAVSWFPEKYGADVMMSVNSGWVGIQRKELSDLVASVQDGRLGQQIAQMKALQQAVLVVEGKPRWTFDGELMLPRMTSTGFTRNQYNSVLWSVRDRGVWVDFTEDVAGTKAWCEAFDVWVRKQKHTSLDKRPGPKSVWGKPGNEDFAKHLVMGIPGVGSELAARIVERFGVPFQWKISVEDLMSVEGIGKKKAQTIWAAIGE
jgi:ERCC4-type nuclease